MTSTRRTIAAALAALAAVGVSGAALATARSLEIVEHAQRADNDDAADGAEDGDAAIADATARRRASDAALAWLRSEHGERGVVSGTEVGDEESYYEIEVTLGDGRQVDVQLDEQFNVVGLD